MIVVFPYHTHLLVLLWKCKYIAVISFFKVLTVQMLGAPMPVDFIKTVQYVSTHPSNNILFTFGDDDFTILKKICNVQVTHSRTGRRISHGYNSASFVAIRIGP